MRVVAPEDPKINAQTCRAKNNHHQNLVTVYHVVTINKNVFVFYSNRLQVNTIFGSDYQVVKKMVVFWDIAPCSLVDI
jgi:hypothetical protein